MMKVTTLAGITFPALLDNNGVLTDSRTGEKAFGDKWEEISEKEYNALCDKFNLD